MNNKIFRFYSTITIIIATIALSTPSVSAQNNYHTYFYRDGEIVYDLDGNALRLKKYFERNFSNNHKKNYHNNLTQSRQTFHINISHDEFSPSILRINKGDTIIWTNLESRPHTVTGKGSDNNYLKSNKLNKGNIYSKTFNATGTFRYQDIYNPEIKAKIIVENK